MKKRLIIFSFLAAIFLAGHWSANAATCAELSSSGQCTPKTSCVNNLVTDQASNCGTGICCIPVDYTVPTGKKCSEIKENALCVPPGTCINYVSDKATDCGTGVCCIPMTITPPPPPPPPTPPQDGNCPAGSTCFANPIVPTTLQGLLGSILTALQNIVAIIAIIMIIIGGIMYMFAGVNEKNVETAKKMIGGAVIGLAIVVAAPAFLKEILTILGGPITDPRISAAPSLKTIAERILNLLLSIVGILGIIGLVIGGMFYLTAYGDEKKIDKGKTVIKASIIGIIVSLAALVIVRQVAALLG